MNLQNGRIAERTGIPHWRILFQGKLTNAVILIDFLFNQ